MKTPEPGVVQRVLARSDERDAYEARILAAERDARARYDALADAVGGRVVPKGPTAIEEARYGPGGRAHAGDARPGDFVGYDRDPAAYEAAAEARRAAWDAAVRRQSEREARVVRLDAGRRPAGRQPRDIDLEAG